MFDKEYIAVEELSCRCYGKSHFQNDTLRRSITVREQFNMLVVINSGYR
ncbi:hypothetical protein [Microbulbifer sp. 2205BS26-8]|nr:hypothetical protein [Microbulbifer sp. 2205BS26-8]MDP5211053.1 hypothetical protein [Microbulbifer sp. 2205BS26-8]